jgi:hypothetical protein
LASIHPPSGHLLWSFNWYQSQFGHLLALTCFVTRMRHGERCYEAYRFQWRGFRLLEEPNPHYLLSQGCTIWEIVQEAYVIPDTLDYVTQCELQMYEINYKALNLNTTALGRKVYDRASHLKMAHDV